MSYHLAAAIISTAIFSIDIGAILKSYLKDLYLDIRVHGILLSS